MNDFTCRICGADTYIKKMWVPEKMFASGETYLYHQCSHCNVLQIAEFINDVHKLYPKRYYSFSLKDRPVFSALKQCVHFFSVAQKLGIIKIPIVFNSTRKGSESVCLKGLIQKNHRILDVGCGRGELLQSLYWLGFKKIKGIDPYIEQEITHRGWSIEKKFLTELTENNAYDIIMLHHSFEHLSNPQESLNKIRDLLVPGGVCIIRIPVCDSYAFDHYQENWVQLDAPRHTFLHTNKSMRLLSHSASLSLKKTIDDSDDFQFIGSEQYQKNIPLSSPLSHYKPLIKKLFTRPLFSRKQLLAFQKDAKKLNQEGKGDQRAFYIIKPG